MINKLFIILLSLYLTLTANASGAIAYSLSQNQYFIAINKANKQEAINAVSNICQEEVKDCELVHATNGGGYGAIAKSAKNGASSSALGYRSKKEVESLLLRDCNKKFGKCYISSSWQDVGRIVEVPARRGCINSRTGASDYYCTGIDVNGQPTF